MIATKHLQNFALAFRFHAFRGEIHPECAHDADDAPNDRYLLALVIKIGNKAAINLYSVEREFAQIAERRITASEVDPVR